MILRAESASRPPTSTPADLDPGRDLVLLGIVVGPDADREQQTQDDERHQGDQDLVVTCSVLRALESRGSAFPCRSNSTFRVSSGPCPGQFRNALCAVDAAPAGSYGGSALGCPRHDARLPSAPDADQGPGPPGRVEGDGARGRLPFSWRRGQDPQLRRRQARGREAGRAPALEARPGDQGQPGLAADPLPAARRSRRARR